MPAPDGSSTLLNFKCSEHSFLGAIVGSSLLPCLFCANLVNFLFCVEKLVRLRKNCQIFSRTHEQIKLVKENLLVCTGLYWEVQNLRSQGFGFWQNIVKLHCFQELLLLSLKGDTLIVWLAGYDGN